MQKAAEGKMLEARAGVLKITTAGQHRSGTLVGLALILCGLALIAWGIMADIRPATRQVSDLSPARALSPTG